MTFGIPGFFVPRMLSPFPIPEEAPQPPSFYDTEPLRTTLCDLVDFERINGNGIRLSLGAANVCTGESVYFDNTKMQLGPEHVMASCALPPGFPPINIEGQWYWDGGILCNTPLWYVVDEAYRSSSLILQVDLFNGPGDLPRDLDQVQARMKDLQYASKSRFNATRVLQLEELRTSLRRVLALLPQALRTDPD